MIALGSIFSISYSQTNYDDVAVVINNNSDASVQIGTYFAGQRSLPDENMIYIDCLDEEEVDTTEFKNIVSQIKSHLVENNLTESINYLVTTKGIPVNISYSDSCLGMEGIHCRSLDNKLTLINSSLIDDLIKPNLWIENPYYDAKENFSSDQFDFYMVTRLDGLENDSILAMIDKTGPNKPVVKEEAMVLIDFVHYDTNMIQLFTNYFSDAIDFLDYNNWNHIFDPDTTLVNQMDDLLIYASMIYDTNLASPDFNWMEGSFLNTIFTYSEFSFYNSGEEFQYSFMSLMNTGASGGGAYVNGYFASQGFDPGILYSRYLNDTSETRYNLAESYYASIPRLSYQYVVFGDPKTSLDIVYAGMADPEVSELDIRIYPNPGKGIFYLYCTGDQEIKSVGVYNQFGQKLRGFAPGSKMQNKMQLDLQDLSAGIYFLKVIPVSGPAVTHKLVKQ